MSGFRYFQFSLKVGASLQGWNKLEEDVVSELLLNTRLLDEDSAELLLNTRLLDEDSAELPLVVERSLRELDRALSLKELLLDSSAEEKVSI
jgi:hypothetical protein